MKVVALVGDVDTGKSHTINIVYYFLLRSGYTQVPGHFRILGNLAFEDVFDVLTIPGKKVGIIGMGDYAIGTNSLKNLLQQMDVIGCDVVVCACRNKPRIEAAVKAYSPHIFVSKTLSAGRDNDRIVNVADATILVNHV